jgi:hypothetical protein
LVAAGLPDADNNYFLKANYYGHVVGDGARWWLAAMWLNEETTKYFELGPMNCGLMCCSTGNAPTSGRR